MSGHIPRTHSRPSDALSRTGSKYNCPGQQNVRCTRESNSHAGALSPTENGTRCLILLERCLAIKLLKVSLRPDGKKVSESRSLHNRDFWMYDNGYLLFQDFLEQNLKCFWNTALLEAVRVLKFRGYVAPGVLMVTANPCALEVVRSAWARNVLRPPTNFIILIVGDITDCVVEPLPQGHFTPLPEALCWVILELTSSGQSAVLPEIFSALQNSFPDMEVPSNEVIYDVLAQLMAEEKVYQTSKGFFVMTPERKRREVNHHRRHCHKHGIHSKQESKGVESYSLLMSPEEALVLVHGEMQTIRDGEVTHQALQTNLADIICGGNPNDKILHPNVGKNKQHFGFQRHMDRRHSLRIFGSSKRLSLSPSRCSSMRHIPNKHGIQMENASSTECHTTVCSKNCSEEKKPSFLSRLFRRSLKKRACSPAAPLSTFGAQFPPSEWFNPRVVHLHSIGTQTQTCSSKSEAPLSSDVVSNIIPWSEEGESKAATLPRRHRRLASGDSAISLTTYNQSHTVTTTSNSTPRSSRRHRSPSFRQAQQVHSFYGKSDNLSCSTSRNSVLPHVVTVPLPNSSLPHSIDVTAECCKPRVPPLPVGSNDGCNKKVTSSHVVCPNVNKLSLSMNRSNYSVKSSVACSHKSSSNKTLCSSKTVSVKKHEKCTDCDLTDDVAAVSYNNEKPNQISSNLACLPQNNTMSFASQSEENKNWFQFQVSPGTSHNSSCPSSKTVKNEESNIVLSKNEHTTSTVSAIQCGDFTAKSVVASTLCTNSSSNITISECSTKINQQQNSTVNSNNVFENGVKNDKNSFVHASRDIVVLNCFSAVGKDSIPSVDENSQLNGEKNCEMDIPSKLISTDALSRVQEASDFSNCSGERDSNFQESDSTDIVTETIEEMNLKHDNIKKESINIDTSSSIRSSSLILKFGNSSETDITVYPNVSPTGHNAADPTMNNARQRSSITTAILPVKSKEELDYKNVFQRDLTLLVDGSFSIDMKNEVLSIPATAKSFDSFEGSFGNLFLKGVNSEDKLNGSSNREFMTGLKNLDEARFKGQDKDQNPGEKWPKLSPCASLGDLRVSFKSITAQNIMKGISINSVDTLVEVNVSASEKQKNYDSTICTDFGIL